MLSRALLLALALSKCPQYLRSTYRQHSTPPVSQHQQYLVSNTLTTRTRTTAELYYTGATGAIATGANAKQAKQPHIVFVLIDDLGFNDFSWRSSDLQWPNVAKLLPDAGTLQALAMRRLCCRDSATDH